MRYFKNIINGKILNEKEYQALLVREAKEMWETDANLIVEDFKEEGKTEEEYIAYMLKEDDGDFIEVDEDGETIEM